MGRWEGESVGQGHSVWEEVQAPLSCQDHLNAAQIFSALSLVSIQPHLQHQRGFLPPPLPTRASGVPVCSLSSELGNTVRETYDI